MPTSIGPIIKVDGEKEYRASMKNIITTTKELDSELKATATSFDNSGKAQNTNAQKVDALKKKIELQKKAIADANDMCEKAKQKYGEDSVEAQKYQTQVNNLTAELNKMNNELKEAGGSPLGAKLKDVSEGMKSISEKGVQVGTAMTKYVTGPIVGVGAAAMAAWKGVDEGMDNVVKMTGATGDALDGLQTSLKNVYSNSTLDMDTLSTALGEINTRFGYTGEQLEETTELFSEFASVNDDDVVSAVDNADKIMKQFGVSADKTDGYLGLLTKTAQDTGVSTSDLQASLAKNGSTLRSMGLDVGKSVKLMANLSKAGFDDETAMKAMSKAAQNYSKDGQNAEEGMRNLIAGVQDGSISFEELAEVVGTKNALAFQEMAESGALSLDDLETNLDDYSDVVGTTFENTQDPIDQMQVVFHNLQIAGADLFNTIGTIATPIIAKLAEGAKKLSDWWAGMSPETQAMIVKIAAIAAAIGPVILMISKVVGVVSLLVNPIGLVVTAIAGVATAIGVLWAKNEAFRDFVTGLWNGLVETATGIWNTITGLFTGEISVTEVLTKAWDGLTGIAETIWGAVKGFFTQTINLKEIATTVWENAKNFASGAWDAIKGYFEGAAPVVKTIASTAWDTAKTVASTIWDGIKSTWEGAAPIVKSIATTAWENAKTFASNAWNAIKGFFEGDAPVVKAIATTAWENAKTFASNAWDAIKGFFESAAPVVKQIGTSAWTAAKQAASHAWEDIKGFFESAAPVVKEIATTAWDNAQAAGEAAWSAIKTAFEGAAPVIKEIATTAWDNAKTAAGNVWDAICDIFSGDFPFPDIAGMARNAFSSVKNAAKSAWDWICGLFGGDEGEDLKTGEVDTSSISGATAEMEKSFQEIDLKISDVDVSSITAANLFVNNSVLSYKRMFDNQKLAFPTVNIAALAVAKKAVTMTVTEVKTAINTVKLILPTINVNCLNLMKTAVNTAVSAVKTSINTVSLVLPTINVSSLNTMKSSVSTAVSAVKSSINTVSLSLPSVNTSSLNTMKSAATTAANNVKSTINNMSLSLPTVGTSSLGTAQSTASTVANKIKSLINDMSLALPTVGTSSLGTAQSTASSVGSKIKSSINDMVLKLPTVGTSSLGTAVETAKTAASNIEKAFSNISAKISNISISYPTPKDLKVKWSSSSDPDGENSVYTADLYWADKGGIFYNPAIIGVGEKRPEFVGALEDLKEIVKAAMMEAGGRQGTTFNQYNYSPKALSRLEIYRQTRNLVAFA